MIGQKKQWFMTAVKIEVVKGFCACAVNTEADWNAYKETKSVENYTERTQ